MSKLKVVEQLFAESLTPLRNRASAVHFYSYVIFYRRIYLNLRPSRLRLRPMNRHTAHNI